MTDKTEFNDNLIKGPNYPSNQDVIDKERYRVMWEKMLKIEQIKKDDQRKNIIRMTLKKTGLN